MAIDQVRLFGYMSSYTAENGFWSGSKVYHLVPEGFISHFVFGNPATGISDDFTTYRIFHWYCHHRIPYHETADIQYHYIFRHRWKVHGRINGDVPWKIPEHRWIQIVEGDVVFKRFGTTTVLIHMVDIP